MQVFSPARVVFSGVGVLLLVSCLDHSLARTLVNNERCQAAKDVAASQDILVDLFGRVESFFRRLEIYTGVPLTPAMTDKMVEIAVEVLDILATATREMKQTRASEFVHRQILLMTHIDSEKFVKRVAGRTDLEDGLNKLDKLTNEESLLASAQLLKVTHDIHSIVTDVAGNVEGFEEKVQVVVSQVEDIKYDVQLVSDQVEVVDKRIQVMATAMETKLLLQQPANELDDVMRSCPLPCPLIAKLRA